MSRFLTSDIPCYWFGKDDLISSWIEGKCFASLILEKGFHCKDDE